MVSLDSYKPKNESINMSLFKQKTLKTNESQTFGSKSPKLKGTFEKEKISMPT